MSQFIDIGKYRDQRVSKHIVLSSVNKYKWVFWFSKPVKEKRISFGCYFSVNKKVNKYNKNLN